MGNWKSTFGEDRPSLPNGMLEEFRSYVEDYKQYKRLFRKEELTDEFLCQALTLGLDDFNSTTPANVPCRFNFDSHPSVFMLFHGAAIQVFKRLGLRHTANQLSYSDGGINVAVNDKTGLYQSWIAQYAAEYEQKKQMLKTQMNAELSYGEISSEYRTLNGYYG